MHLRFIKPFAAAWCASALLSGCVGAARTPSALPFVSADAIGVPDASGTNVVKNGSFDTGKLKPWSSCGKAKASVSSVHPYDGKHDALTGSPTTKKEVAGWSAICQRVTVPAHAKLAARLYRITNEPNDKHAYQEVALANASGKPVTVLSKGNANASHWVAESWNLEKYAGQQVTLFFGVYGSGRSHLYDTQYVDDVTLTGKVVTSNPLTVNPTSLTFKSADTQTFAAQETGYSGALTATSSDTTIVTVSPASGHGPSATFTVTPQGGGAAKISVEDAQGQKATVAVKISSGIIIVNHTGPKHARIGGK